jgi:pimeloyl-ACP methyl ester carboxylesterase
MNRIKTKDGTAIYYKDWGTGDPIVFSHGWPLTADAWDAQMLFFGQRGYRVIAHDRRGHGRSTQTWNGNDMDTYSDDLAALFEALDLRNAIMVGHSNGGGEVARYLGRHGTARVAKAALIGAVTRTPAGYPSRCSTACGRHLPPTGPNSTRTSRSRFTDTTAREQKYQKASASTGGCRA